MIVFFQHFKSSNIKLSYSRGGLLRQDPWLHTYGSQGHHRGQGRGEYLVLGSSSDLLVPGAKYIASHPEKPFSAATPRWLSFYSESQLSIIALGGDFIAKEEYSMFCKMYYSERLDVLVARVAEETKAISYLLNESIG